MIEGVDVANDRMMMVDGYGIIIMLLLTIENMIFKLYTARTGGGLLRRGVARLGRR